MERKWEYDETFKTEFIIHEFRFLMIASDPRNCQAQTKKNSHKSLKNLSKIDKNHLKQQNKNCW